MAGPIVGRVAKGEKIRIDEDRPGVVAQRPQLHVGDIAAGLLHDYLSGGGIPFAGRTEAGV